MNLRCIIKPTKTQEDVNYEKNYLDYLVGSYYLTSVLFTGCGEVAPSNAQTSDEADTTALSDTTPTADPNQFSVEFYDYKTNELISKSNKNNLDEKLKEAINLTNTTSEQKVESIDVEPTYVILLSYLKDTSRDIWVLIYVKGDDVYVQADKRHANINLDTAGYDIYKSKFNKSQLEELIK